MLTQAPDPAQRLPCLVVEVAYSQRYADLERLARGYITDSRGAVQCVLGLDLPYPMNSAGSRSTVTLSIWRPDKCSPDGINVQSHCFDLHNLSSPNHDVLRLFPTDLLPSSVLPSDPALPALARLPIGALASAVRDAKSRTEVLSVFRKHPEAKPQSFRRRARPPSTKLSPGSRQRLMTEYCIQKKRKVKEAVLK
jgi:hypothetical protein